MCRNPIPIKENFFLQIEKSLVDEIVTKNGFKLYLAPEYNFEENVTVTGKVAVCPLGLESIIKEGDEVAFSYAVVSDRAFPNTSDHFVAVSEGGQWVKIFMNGKGEKIRMMAHKGVISVFWTGTFFDANGRFVQELSYQGTEDQVERWATQNFKFGDCDSFKFRNKILVDGKEYWKCSLSNIFAKKEKGKIISVGDRVICKMVDIPVDKQLLKMNNIHLPNSSVQVRFYDRGKVVSGGERLGIKKGQIVSFESKYCEKYKLFGKDYFLIKERRIEGMYN